FIACIMNILLDLLFVATFQMGAKGAALATMLAQTTSVLTSLLIIRKRELPFEFHTKDIGFDSSYIKNILSLGAPIAIQSGLVSVSFLAVTAILNTYGVIASAAVGIVAKITSLVMIVPQAFSQSISAFTAQNFGAKRMDRVNQGLKYSISISLVFGIIMAYLGIWHGTIFTQFFTNDPETTQAALLYLKSYSIDTVLVCFLFSMNGYFNGCGKTKFVMLQSVVCAFCIRIPLAYLISRIDTSTLFEIGLATPASTFTQIILCFIFYRHFQKELLNRY
ncbi:MAG: MATE family efflux transporter, partial [Erysipelotrichaceae bacterium]